MKHPLILATIKNRSARANLVAKMKRDMATYFDVKTGADVKSPDPNSTVDRELKLLDDEFKVMRDTFRSMFQNQSLKINLYQVTAWNTIVTGLVSGSDAIDVTTATEFAPLALLFDEFRVVGGHCDIVVCGTVVDTGSNIPHIVFGYDPSDNTALASLAEGMQLEQHIVKNLPVVATGFNTYPAPQVKYGKWEWKVPKGIMLQQTSGTAVIEGAWQSTTNGTPAPYGWFKTYGSTLQASVKLALSVIKTMHVEFRCRT